MSQWIKNSIEYVSTHSKINLDHFKVITWYVASDWSHPLNVLSSFEEQDNLSSESKVVFVLTLVVVFTLLEKPDIQEIWI